MGRKIVEHTISPESPILKGMIGQKILDIGFYHGHSKEGKGATNTREGIKSFLRSLGGNWQISFSWYGDLPAVLVLEKQHLCLISRKTIIPKLEANSNLTLDRMTIIEPEIKYYFYSVNQDPDMSDEIVREMIGKRILALDLIRVSNDEAYTHTENRYCILKLYLEGGIVKLVGTQYIPSSGIEIKEADDIDPARIDEVIPIRKEGYSID